jgi:hypothetical protein
MPEDPPLRWPSDEEPEPRGREASRVRRGPAGRLTLLIWVVSTVLIIGGLVVWLIPVTAVYYRGEKAGPYDIRTIYGTRSDQTLIFPSNLEDPDSTEPVTLVTSVRLGCGTALSDGENETEEPDGPEACSSAEWNRNAGGFGLVVLGGLGIFAGFRRASHS